MSAIKQKYANAMGYYLPFIIKAEHNTEATDDETIDIKELLGQRQRMMNRIIEATAALIKARTKTATR
ncbi:hypothetical protein C922_05484 [Plasmodium inui San Antonio 1]|uniref:Uncharacterized protein n=1 Tax=Plasmodium inui San Antonio 1 TaxID=1237626 RepID=W6ZXY5_9APIC|nr:hypothetical protein C922_05484 [Plasmodium inui San Antonio 1]EUD64135.1 hypothetical protein C922_05484 [Plasmodium inui San Antonio 1]